MRDTKRDQLNALTFCRIFMLSKSSDVVWLPLTETQGLIDKKTPSAPPKLKFDMQTFSHTLGNAASPTV